MSDLDVNEFGHAVGFCCVSTISQTLAVRVWVLACLFLGVQKFTFFFFSELIIFSGVNCLFQVMERWRRLPLDFSSHLLAI